MENKNKNYDEYIVFLLGTDNFKISKFIREIASDFGMDNLYEDCIYIAQQFEIYDKGKENYIDQYSSLEKFLNEYEKQIKTFLVSGIKFEVENDQNN